MYTTLKLFCMDALSRDSVTCLFLEQKKTLQCIMKTYCFHILTPVY